MADRVVGSVGWQGADEGTEEAGARALPLTVVCRGDVPQGVQDYAIERFTTLAEHVGDPVLFARIKLTVEPDPARDRPVIAEVAFDVNGELVRAHIAAHELREAIDLLQRRLRGKLEHRAEHREAVRRRSGVAVPGEWRHGDLAAPRPDWFPRPAEERQVVAHKAFAVGACTVDEAVFDLEQADFDFYLFTELATGADACVDRQADGSYGLTRLRDPDADPGPMAVTVHRSPAVAPTLAEAEAIELLEAAGAHHVFHADPDTGRGRVLYRRYDGHYGLLTAT
jgi:hypothetical protein